MALESTDGSGMVLGSTDGSGKHGWFCSRY